MAGADFTQALSICMIIEFIDGIRAEKGERVFSAEIIPQLLQAARCVAVAIRPKEGHHLAKSANPPPSLRKLANDSAHDFREQVSVWRAVHHEFRERLRRVQSDVATAIAGSRYVHALLLQLAANTIPMGRGGDDGHALFGSEGGGDIGADRFD